ncbi:hypothetical protein Q1M63_11785 (plasmid) [Sinorhizobium meliloti]|nr:hypothetical protein Q1M63_11785 [Sinorhizobium meliloti]
MTPIVRSPPSAWVRRVAPGAISSAPRTLAVREGVTVLAELAGAQLTDVLDSLVDAMMQMPTGRRRLAAIVALTQARKGSDGFLEFVGETHEGAIFLRGWARAADPGNARVIVCGENPVVADCGIATFSRQDTPQGGAGFIGLLAASEPLRARDVEGLVYRGRGGWRYASVHEHRLIAGPTDTPGHIRFVLLQTHSTPAVLLRLRSAANSFEGRETISTLPCSGATGRRQYLSGEQQRLSDLRLAARP